MSYRILSLDGGGIHGYASVILIKRLLKEYPDLIKNVDLIAGTSIGGIIALGLAMGHPIDFVDKNFRQGIPLAFKTNYLRLASFIAGFCQKYDLSEFEEFLFKIYGDTTLDELEKKVIVPAFELDNGYGHHRRWKAKVFHNYDGPTGDPTVSVLDVALATSAVPVFFKTYKNYIDGAFVANNPSLVAITQTQDKNSKIFPQPNLNDLAILSIGSIRDEYVEGKNLEWGYFQWIKPLLQISTERDTLVINHQCEILFKDHYHRIEPVINGSMDNFNAIYTIKGIAQSYDIDQTTKWLERYW